MPPSPKIIANRAIRDIVTVQNSNVTDAFSVFCARTTTKRTAETRINTNRVRILHSPSANDSRRTVRRSKHGLEA